MNDRCRVQGDLGPEQNSAYGLLRPFYLAAGFWRLVSEFWLPIVVSELQVYNDTHSSLIFSSLSE